MCHWHTHPLKRRGELPELPARAGCSAAWPALDWDHITASRTVEAVYTPYLSALSDGSRPAQVLAEGSLGSGGGVLSFAMDCGNAL